MTNDFTSSETPSTVDKAIDGIQAALQRGGHDRKKTWHAARLARRKRGAGTPGRACRDLYAWRRLRPAAITIRGLCVDDVEPA
jgi:hypothetical protein